MIIICWEGPKLIVHLSWVAGQLIARVINQDYANVEWTHTSDGDHNLWKMSRDYVFAVRDRQAASKVAASSSCERVVRDSTPLDDGQPSNVLTTLLWFKNRETMTERQWRGWIWVIYGRDHASLDRIMDRNVFHILSSVLKVAVGH